MIDVLSLSLIDSLGCNYALFTSTLISRQDFSFSRWTGIRGALNLGEARMRCMINVRLALEGGLRSQIREIMKK